MDMSLTAAATGFVVCLLSLSVVQGQDRWGIAYSTSEICALKGATVEISCTYSYPRMINGLPTAVENTFWYRKLQDKVPFDLRADAEYAGRVQYHCEENSCTLRITDLRESDSAQYILRFMTNQEGGSFSGAPGVYLSVTGFQVQIYESEPCKTYDCTWSHFECKSRCRLPGQTSYIWYKNEEKIQRLASNSYEKYFYSANSYSCAVHGYEESPSPSVCGHGHSCNRVMYNDRTICAFKGSSVDISCTYNSYGNIISKFWFSREQSHHLGYYKRPKDLSKASQYSDRFQVIETERGRSTLRISDLSEGDSAEYCFKFRTTYFQWQSKFPGTSLTVKDPDLQVQVIWSAMGPRLICHSSCIHGGRSPFVWFKNETKIIEETSSSYQGLVDPADMYSCAYERYHSFSVYAPTPPSVLMRPTGDIMRNSSVTLTCSSEANPAPRYTWYKKNQSLLKEPHLYLHSVQSADSGEYYCTAENMLGRRKSKYVSVNVKYCPQVATLSVSPSGEIVEGSTVTLTCSSDANPAANYTWYKENHKLLEGQESIYNFTNISSEDRGLYYCKSENQYGRVNSTSLFLDVHYGPKLPSVSVILSAEVVEGSLVTLICSSDANPAANHTWYKENEDSPKASGPSFTISDFRAELSGNYYCVAQNTLGRHTSAFHMMAIAGARMSAAVGTITAVLLAIILLTVFFWIRRKKSSIQQSTGSKRPGNRAQQNIGPMCENASAAAQRRRPEQPDPLRYASIRFFQNQADVLYSNVRPARPHRWSQEEDREDQTEYATVQIKTAGRHPGKRRTSNKHSKTEKRQGNMGKRPPEELDDLQYASVYFSNSIRPARPRRHTEQQDVTEYAAVKLNSNSAAMRAGSQETGEDSAALYRN
ncbi:B-cell receptor CD22 isoform X1 [Labrus bergylta]|uniref:B-cell receptor CD22 isoform X1 n=1 Tax=Labrus bergylta TaxID=56723 RepID=UPI0033132BBB